MEFQYKFLLFDVWNVLFSRSAPAKTQVPQKTLKNILSSKIWFEYERGRFSESECHRRLADAFGLQPSDIAQALHAIREALSLEPTIAPWAREVKNKAGNQLTICGIQNISREDFAVLRERPADWAIFDHVFTSGHIGMRKPDLGFYRYVLRAMYALPEEVIFVDDKPENLLAARSIGICGVQFKDAASLRHEIKNLLENPIQRGKDFLEKNAKRLDSVTTTGHSIRENFTQLLILEATQNRDLVYIHEHPRTWNFFIGKPLLTTDDYPDDFDTTSTALLVLKPKRSIVHSVMDELLEYVDEDGILLTYLDRSRPRTDPVVCVNALKLFYKHGRAHELPQTLQWVRDVLTYRAYLDGTRYYPTPEAFLYFLSRLLESSDSLSLNRNLFPLLKTRIQERIGIHGDALCLAMRLLTCQFVGVTNQVDMLTLRSMQCEDGGWGSGWVYRYGSSSGIMIGNRGLATALAINALSQDPRTDNFDPEITTPISTESAKPTDEPNGVHDFTPFWTPHLNKIDEQRNNTPLNHDGLG